MIKTLNSVCDSPNDYRPVQHWNDGKQQEFKERKEYIIDNKTKR